MTPELLYAFAGAGLWGIGLFGFMQLRHLLRKLLAFNLIGSGTFLVLVGLAQHQQGPDAVPQAMVLTGIVVSIAATALAVVLIRRFFHLTGHTSLESNDRAPGAEGDE